LVAPAIFLPPANHCSEVTVEVGTPVRDTDTDLPAASLPVNFDLMVPKAFLVVGGGANFHSKLG
jgi:hypothetical protein